jgi:hypothetical protein
MTANALFGGDPRMSISGRTGNGVILGYRWAQILAPMIDGFFGTGHCLSSATIPNPNNVQVGVNYLLFPITFIKYVVCAALSFMTAACAIVFVNWWIIFLADANGNLPTWCSYFQTFDAPIPKGWKSGVAWLNRNPAYGFDLFVYGIPFNPADWIVRHFSVTPNGTLFFATSTGGDFNFYYQGKFGTYKFGWKDWNCFNQSTQQSEASTVYGNYLPICFTFNPFKNS